MARHKVGKSYLSDEELEAHKSSNWEFGLFVVVGLLVGFIVTTLTESIDEKVLRFSLIIGSGLLSGFIAAKLSEIIRWFVVVFVFLGVVYFIGKLIWDSI